ncbi:type II toxin-antitoxin system HigB family toxin, partial [Microcoleus sp. LAD1_D5]
MASLVDIRKVFPSADLVGNFTVFNPVDSMYMWYTRFSSLTRKNESLFNRVS